MSGHTHTHTHTHTEENKAVSCSWCSYRNLLYKQCTAEVLTAVDILYMTIILPALEQTIP